MDFKNKIIIKILFVFLIPLNLYSLRLPVPYAKLTSTFGESRGDHFHNGIDFGGGNQKIYSFMKGNIIFYYDKSDFPFDNYMGGGNFLIVDHKGIYRSYYLHLKENSINKKLFEVDETNVIGISSDTGHSYGVHLHFHIEKMSPHEFINPLIFYKDILNDTIKPTIEGIYLYTDMDNNIVKIGREIRIKPCNKIQLLLKAYDKINKVKYKMAPFTITVFINGDRTLYYKFDKLLIKDNEYVLYPSYKFNDVYYKKYYKIGNIKPTLKSYIVKVVVTDLWGNSRETTKKVIIK